MFQSPFIDGFLHLILFLNSLSTYIFLPVQESAQVMYVGPRRWKRCEANWMPMTNLCINFSAKVPLTNLFTHRGTRRPPDKRWVQWHGALWRNPKDLWIDAPELEDDGWVRGSSTHNEGLPRWLLSKERPSEGGRPRDWKKGFQNGIQRGPKGGPEGATKGDPASGCKASDNVNVLRLLAAFNDLFEKIYTWAPEQKGRGRGKQTLTHGRRQTEDEWKWEPAW